MDFLLEIGCEEIPARFLPPALEQIERLFLDSATAARLAPAEGKLEVTTGATPRRLVLWARGLAKRQPDVEEEICGPKVEAAYGQDGQPTKACIGFARSRGVDPERLVRIQTDRGEVVGLRRKI